MGYSIQICEISHQTFGSSHRRCLTCPTVLQLNGHPVAKCDLWNGRATQILPNTGPTGNPRISFAKVYVRSSQTMQPCWTCGYQIGILFFQYFYVGPPKSCVDHPTYQLGGPLGDPGFFVSCNTGPMIFVNTDLSWSLMFAQPMNHAIVIGNWNVSLSILNWFTQAWHHMNTVKSLI